MPDSSSLPPSKSVCHYFVDEAGDTTLFNRKGEVIIGEEGCSRYFMMGLLHVDDPVKLATSLETLRQNLLSDPYFRRVPSMQPENGKTAVMFHAKDDLAEVRREVFRVLAQQGGLRFYAAVRDKHRGILREVNQYKRKRYQPNEQYDQLVKRLFKDRLHKEDEYVITFATRGAKDRTRALTSALEEARRKFEKQWGIHHDAPMTIRNVAAKTQPCLQAADYLLWAVQRCYERREDRYLDYVWPLCHLVHDVDDHRKKLTGVYYTQKNPLLLAGLPPFEDELT